MKIDITTNFTQVEDKLRRMQQDIAGQALASAVNKTIALARTQMVKEIAGEFNVSAGYVRERLRVQRATARAAVIVGALMGGKSDRRRSANIIAFVERSVSLAEGRKRAKAGTLRKLFVKVKRKGGKKALDGNFGQGAFIGNKGRTVFERVPGTQMASRKWGGKHGEQIAPVQVIDVAQMFNMRRINASVVALIKARFPDVFEREAKFFVDRFNSKAGA